MKKSIYGVILTLPNILLRNLIGNPDFLAVYMWFGFEHYQQKDLRSWTLFEKILLIYSFLCGWAAFSINFSMQHPRAIRVKKLNNVAVFNPDFLFLSFSFPIFQQFSKVCISKRFAIFYESTPHTSKTNQHIMWCRLKIKQDRQTLPIRSLFKVNII